MPDLAQLPVGHEFAPVTRRLQPDEVDLYIEAVQESNDMFRERDVVPPTALGAYALAVILREFDLPAGAVHAAQEMSFSGAVGKEDTVLFRARLAQNSVRGGWRFLGFDFSATDAQGKQVVEGRSTVLVPESRD